MFMAVAYLTITWNSCNKLEKKNSKDKISKTMMANSSNKRWKR